MLAVGLGLLAFLLLGYGLWARLNRPLYAGRAARASLTLIVLALVCGIGAVLLRPSQAPPAQLASLSGNKPPLATAAPTEIPLPSPTPRLPGPAQEQEPPAEAGQPMLETRPTGRRRRLRSSRCRPSWPTCSQRLRHPCCRTTPSQPQRRCRPPARTAAHRMPAR